ncbi:hypothetical protein ACLB2K_024612 [Fragaria x ananassa]
MSSDLLLKPSCGGCGSTSDLYGSNCKHMTLCCACGKTMAENKAKCYDCGAVVTRLIREYNVRASTASEKSYFIGRFVTGLPNFSKKKSAENKWTLRKDLSDPRRSKDKDGQDQKKYKDVRPPTEASREKLKNKPWVLEDETGHSQYNGQLEGAQSAIYYLLMLQGKEFSAIPAGSWFNFNKVAQYKQLTLEEAEEKMNNRKKTQDGYERWMMKSGTNGPGPLGEKEPSVASAKGRKKMTGDDDEGNFSDKGEEDEDEETARKNRVGLNKKGGDDEDDEGGNEDDDLDDDSSEKGDDWEHEEIFTDDDEAVGINPEEREEFEPEVPAPPEIKQDDDDDDANEGEGGLSKSGKELKKLLGRSGGLNDSDGEDDDDDDDDMDDDIALPQPLAPKQKDAPKQEPVDNSPVKPGASGSAAKANPSASKSAKGKRKSNGDDNKTPNSAPTKKVKTDNEQKSVKEEPAPDSTVPAKGTAAPSKPGSTPSGGRTGPVTEEEIRAVLMQKSPITTRDLVNNFPGRLKTKEEKDAFAAILRIMSRIQKNNGMSYVVLREK